MPVASAGSTAHGVVLRAFGSLDVLTLREFPMPQPGPDDVLIATEVAGVNFADTMIRRGEYLRDQQRSMALGCEVAGRVVATGAGAEPLLWAPRGRVDRDGRVLRHPRRRSARAYVRRGRGRTGRTGRRGVPPRRHRTPGAAPLRAAAGRRDRPRARRGWWARRPRDPAPSSRARTWAERPPRPPSATPS